MNTNLYETGMIKRFIEAQTNTYSRAVDEISAGRKRSHWIWYIFPQIAGLGYSYMTKLYAIRDLEEAAEYLAHPLLGARLRQCVSELLKLTTDNPHEVFGSPDDMKVRSCMTLFDVVEPHSVFSKVLDKFYAGKKDLRTLNILGVALPAAAQSGIPEIGVNILPDSKALPLVGAVCGDIIGSSYERYPVKSADFTLFTKTSRYTDDTVCSIAVADALINQKDFAERLKYWCRKYPHVGYGGKFREWFSQENPQPYNSWGNGSAMRVSAVGALGRSIDDVLILAEMSAAVSHNHPEGIKGAQATALAIYLALNGDTKDEIKNEVEYRFGYDLNRKYADIRGNYRFDVSCQGSVPEAIIAFLESSDYESAIRMAVAYGGDADTQAAIAGGIAAAYYGSIPEHILAECFARLPFDMQEVIGLFNQK